MDSIYVYEEDVSLEGQGKASQGLLRCPALPTGTWPNAGEGGRPVAGGLWPH